MNVRRRPRCTFIPSPDVPRGRETVGTTPPPLPAPQKECATPPHSLTRHTTSSHRSDQPLSYSAGPRPSTTSRRRSGQPLSHSAGSPAGPRPSAPPAGVATPATGPRPTRTARHTAEHFVQKVTDCAQSDLDSSLSTQNVTLCTKRPRTPLPPTQPGTLGVGPLAHVEDGSHPHNQEPRLPTDRLHPHPPLSHHQPPTPPTPQTPPPRTSTVLTTNKYRSREQ